MRTERIALGSGEAVGHVADAGPVKIVFATTANGLVGCGAFDVLALDRFRLPAARVSGVATVAELLAGKVNLVNESAKAAGVAAGMSGREALEKMGRRAEG
jgi:uncharacterized protein YunC (DUF1805 family)